MRNCRQAQPSGGDAKDNEKVMHLAGGHDLVVKDDFVDCSACGHNKKMV